MPTRKPKVVAKQSKQPRRSRDHGGHGQIAEVYEDLANEMDGTAQADAEIIQEVRQLLVQWGHRFRESLRLLLETWHKWSGKGVPSMLETPGKRRSLKEQFKHLWANASHEERREMLLSLEPRDRDEAAELLGEYRVADFEKLIFADGPRTLNRFNRFLTQCVGKKIPSNERSFYAHAISWALREQFGNASLMYAESDSTRTACTLSAELTNGGANHLFRIRERGQTATVLWRRTTLPTLVAE